MSNSARIDPELLDALCVGDLILQVDTRRSDYDPFKLTPVLLETLVPRLADARGIHSALTIHFMREIDAETRMATARAQLSAILRRGFDTLRNTPEEDAPASDITQALETYGWERGLLGPLNSPSRIETQARAAGMMSPQLPPLLRYPQPILKQIITWLGVLDAQTLLAGGARTAGLLRDREQKRDLLLQSIARVSHHYCAASDAGASSAELARVGLAEATDNVAPPEACGSITLDADQITFEAKPSDADLVVAWRRSEDGPDEVAGVSAGLSVGVNDFSPLWPGVQYQTWVTSRNVAGLGPASQKLPVTG